MILSQANELDMNENDLLNGVQFVPRQHTCIIWVFRKAIYYINGEIDGKEAVEFCSFW